MHETVVDMSQLFLMELNRHNYVTPTLYLELLSSYTHLLKKKKSELVIAIKRLKTGNSICLHLLFGYRILNDENKYKQKKIVSFF